LSPSDRLGGTARQVCVVIALALSTASSHAAISSVRVGRLGKNPTVCFAGNALTARPERVNAVLDILKDFEAVANIRFRYLGTCPPARRAADGKDFYDGDVRIALSGTSIDLAARAPLPGKGCAISMGGTGDFGLFPNQSAKDGHPCIYNVRLGVEGPRAHPYRNQVLHEIGHILGLYHEHQRSDVDYTLCHQRNFGADGGTDGYLTTYDRYSVMHYEFLRCGIHGNYDSSGLSDKDALGIHILYPENDRVAAFVGNTVGLEGKEIWLQSGWRARGAYLSFVLKSAAWTVDGKTVSQKPDLAVTLPPGTHTFVYTFRDFLDRDYTQRGVLRVLTADDYSRRISGPVAARSALQ
jgi:hypothetical protein